MKQFAHRGGIGLIVIGLSLSALWVILYAELCPNDPECVHLGWTDARYHALIGVGALTYLWVRRA